MFGRAIDWRDPCAALAQIPANDADARHYFETWFEPYAGSHNGIQEGLFTGYYEPELHGARISEGPYTIPLYRRPPDLVMVDMGVQINSKANASPGE
ncbi:hypothetical protein CCP2SC5_170007 [Azospirillaceae bacterium]